MQRLASHADLLDRSGGDPWIRWGVPETDPDGRLPELWMHGDIAIVERTGERRGFWILPLPTAAAEDVAERFHDALIALRGSDLLARVDARTLTVDARHGALAHRVFALQPGGDWEWMWTTTEPPRLAAEDRLIILDDAADAAEINDFSAAHNHRLWTTAGTGHVVHWLGIRDTSGALVAVGGSEREATGVPHLAGIVTHTAHRGRGLGAAISTGLVRWALIDSDVCTLGMYSDNTVARSVYHRIGFDTAHAWHSRPLANPASAGR
ncbi:GNAT family N-acetyltransferase [Microlunatus soli]|uniref:FR47-like protein n=1 Tax=Microlunatus soli TaxID=630515 RepID=A0A1H1UW55_9ACTN|nr:GNAT family N-acetyltransferase [Microlunatus soli]SDS76757.1 FR47-like protein [Microlunatus soli]